MLTCKPYLTRTFRLDTCTECGGSGARPIAIGHYVSYSFSQFLRCSYQKTCHLRCSHDSPVNSWLYRTWVGRRVLGLISRNLGDIAVVELVGTTGLDQSDCQVGILGQSCGECETGGATADDL